MLDHPGFGISRDQTCNRGLEWDTCAPGLLCGVASNVAGHSAKIFPPKSLTHSNDAEMEFQSRRAYPRKTRKNGAPDRIRTCDLCLRRASDTVARCVQRPRQRQIEQERPAIGKPQSRNSPLRIPRLVKYCCSVSGKDANHCCSCLALATRGHIRLRMVASITGDLMLVHYLIVGDHCPSLATASR